MKRAIFTIALTVATSSACAGFLGFGGTSWKEEVLLHDGSKMIVGRSQSYGGRHEIGQPSPIKEHTITFTLPNTDATVKWVSEYSDDIGRTNFNLLAVHILNGTPYIVASPNLCLSYNKWGRPNPPYVFFKYENKRWHRIPLSEFPTEFTTINVALDIRGREGEQLASRGFVSAEAIKELNRHVRQAEYRTILRKPLAKVRSGCGEMIYDGRGGWIGVGWFRNQPTFDACLKYCERHKIEAQYCPCATYFKAK